MAKRLILMLPFLYDETLHLIIKSAHNISHGLWEHVTILFVLEKLAHLINIEEAAMLKVAADHFIYVAIPISVAYVGWKVMEQKENTES